MKIRRFVLVAAVAWCACGNGTEPSGGTVARGAYFLESLDGQPPPLLTSRTEYGGYADVSGIVFDEIVVVNDTLYNRYFQSGGATVRPGESTTLQSSGEQTITGRIVYREE